MTDEVQSKNNGITKTVFVIAALAFVVLTASIVVGVFATDDAYAEENEAKIGDTEYATLADAINAAQPNDNIILLKDVTVTTSITVPSNVTLTVPLAYTLTNEATLTNCGIIVNSGTMEIKAPVLSYGKISGGKILDKYEGPSITVFGGNELSDVTIDVYKTQTGQSVVTSGGATISDVIFNGLDDVTLEDGATPVAIYVNPCSSVQTTVKDITVNANSKIGYAVEVCPCAAEDTAIIENITVTDSLKAQPVEVYAVCNLVIDEGSIELTNVGDVVFWTQNASVITINNITFGDNVRFIDCPVYLYCDLTNKVVIAYAPINVYANIKYCTIEDNYEGPTITVFNGNELSNVTVNVHKTQTGQSVVTSGGATISDVIFNGLDDVTLEDGATPVAIYVNPCSSVQTTVKDITVNANSKIGYAVEVCPGTVDDKVTVDNVLVSESLKACPLEVYAVSDLKINEDNIKLFNVCSTVFWADSDSRNIEISSLYVDGNVWLYNGTFSIVSGNTVLMDKITAETNATLTVNSDASLSIMAKEVIKASDAKKTYDKSPLTAGYESTIVSSGALVVEIETTGTITDVGKATNVISSYKISIGSTDITKYYSNVSVKTGELIIEKASITATYVSETVKCGGTPEYKISYSGFIGEDTPDVFTVAPKVNMTLPIVEGAYTLTPAYGSATNYEFIYLSGVLTVEHDIKAVEKSGNIIAHYKCDGCGEHFIDAAATIKYTLPEEGSKEQSVGAEATVSDGKATVDSSKVTEVDDAVKKIKEADSSATVVAELSTTDSSAKSFSVDSSDMAKLAGNASGVKLSTSSIATTFSSKTVKDIATAGKFDFNASKATSYPAKYKDLIGANGIVLDISLSVDGKAVTQFSEKVTLSFYYVIPAGHSVSELKIWCISGDSPEEFKCTYDETTHMVTAETSHFSQYAVTLDSSSGSSDSNNNTTLYIICGVVAAIVVILVVAGIIVKKH